MNQKMNWRGRLGARLSAIKLYPTRISLTTPCILDEDLHYGMNPIQVPRDYRSIFITPAAPVNLSQFGVFPLVELLSFGGGIGNFHASSNLRFFAANTGPESKTSGVLQGGVFSRMRYYGEYI